MSVKRISFALVALVIVVGFGSIGVKDIANKRDKLEFQKVEIKDLKTELQEVNIKYDDITNKLEDAAKQKEADKAEIEKKEAEKQELEKQKQELEAQLQAKAEQKRKLAEASTRAIDRATSTQTAYAAGSIQQMISTAAIKHGLDPARMLRIAKCESTFNPNAVNKNYYAGGGNPSGLYQYLPETWNRIGGRSPYGVGNGPSSRFDVQHNINVTMWAFANGYSGEWACK